MTPPRTCSKIALVPHFLTLLLLIAALAVPAAADWAQWRGPDQNGRVAAELPEGAFDLEVVWKRDLGSGYSGLSVVGDRLLAMYTDGKDDLLVALEPSTGEELWRYRVGDMTPNPGPSHEGPLSTPVSDGNYVYAVGSDVRLFAVSLDDGTEVWSVPLQETMEAKRPFFGFTSTPVLAEGLVIQQVGGPQAGIAAFDASSGEMRWKAVTGEVEYRSPVLGQLGGRSQVIAFFEDKTYGFDPASGEELWSLDWKSNGSNTPLVVGDDRLLLAADSETALFQVTAEDGNFTLSELWRNSDFKNSFATPVQVGDQLYGFNRSFLTAVDLATGERTWRSRPPGGSGLIAVGDHLAMFGADGHVVFVKASAEGYKEAARVAVSEDGSYTAPIYSDGHIFVRNLKEIAAVRPKAAESVAEAAAEPTNDFEAFVRRVGNTAYKDLLVRQFMADAPSFPLVENDSLLHFVYWGEAEDVALRGSMLNFGQEVPMERIEGTDVFYYTVEVEPGGRWEYQFIVDFENRIADPMNPRRVPGNNRSGELSELDLSGREQPAWVRLYEGDTPGRLETFDIMDRTVTVYLPHGYHESTEDYPVVLVQQGSEWLEGGQLANTLDNVSGQEMAPVVAVFIDPRRRSGELLDRAAKDFAGKLAQELRPTLLERYRLSSEASHWAVLGKGDGAGAAVYAALAHPEAFGHAVAFAYAEARNILPAMTEHMENPGDNPAHFAIHWNRDDFRRAQRWDIPEESAALAETLRKHGFRVSGGEVVDGGGWGSWGWRVVPALAEVFPPDASANN